MNKQQKKSRGPPLYREIASRRQAQLPRTTSYDHESGLVYDEFEVAGRSLTGWINDYKTPSIVKTRNRPNDNGARSLANMVLLKLGIESQNLTVEALQMLPWAIGERIWQQILLK